MDVLARRAAEVGLTLDSARIARIWTYFELLGKWNARINLTGLPVGPDSEEAIDRLLIEPMLASAHAGRARTVVDVGSGGGSPAIPFAIAAASNPTITMVESRERKSTFLREALRQTALEGEVRTARFAEFSDSPSAFAAFDILTVRAVRMDPELLSQAAAVLAPHGKLLWFHERDQILGSNTAELFWEAAESLVPSLNSFLSVALKQRDKRFT